MHFVQHNGYRVVVGGPVPRQAGAITLGKTVIVRKKHAEDQALMAHELVHVRQFGELGGIRFVAKYVGAYLRLRFGGHGHLAAYRRIPLEVEASWISRLHDVRSLEPGYEPVIDVRPAVRAAHQSHRGPGRMWRRRQVGRAATASGQTGG